MNRQSMAAALLLVTVTATASFHVVGAELCFDVDEPFERIHVRGPATLEIRQGGSPEVTVTAIDHVLADVVLDVTDGTLFIEVPEGLEVDDVSFDVTTERLHGIHSEHAVRVVASGLTVGELLIRARGAGSDYHLVGLSAEELTIDVRGALNALVAGRAERQTVDIDGAANYDAGKFRTAMADLRLRGENSSKVWVTDRLEVDIDGAGSVTYRGNPTKYIDGWGYVGR